MATRAAMTRMLHLLPDILRTSFNLTRKDEQRTKLGKVQGDAATVFQLALHHVNALRYMAQCLPR